VSAAELVPIAQVASVVRSKNAGPFTITLDLIFPDRESWEAVRASGAISREAVAALYRVPTERVGEVIEYPAANAFKVNLGRERPSGSVGDRDVYGSQQHVPLLGLRVPRPPN
jgi:hypothetical protein